jgi:hypothetical protein
MEAHEINELEEQQEKGGESGLKAVSFTMSLLAVLLAMTTVLGHRTHTEAVLQQNRVSDEWNFYQAKKIRATDARVAGDMIVALAQSGNAAAQKVADAEHAYAAKESSDLAEEQEKAKDLEHEVDIAEKKAGRFDLGEALLQIGVIVTSITLLTRRKYYWHLGMFFGAVGIVAAALAFFVR